MAEQRFRKTLHPDMAHALNEHVSVEAKAAFMYYALASWAEVRGLNGFAKFFRGEAAGELNHMHQFVNYLTDRDFQATFGNLPAPPTDFETPLDVLEMVCEEEHKLCDQLDRLIELAHRHQDHLSDSFLHQFVPQQIADTSESNDILDRVRMVKNDGQGILLVDQELGAKGG
jgi:ferritin